MSAATRLAWMPLWKGKKRLMMAPPVLFDADPEDFGKLQHSVPVGLLNLLPWGLMPQSMVAELVEPDHRTSQHTKTGTRVYPQSKTSEQLLEMLGGDSEQLCDGVLDAYAFVRKHFNRRTWKWAPLDIMTPPLATCFQTMTNSYNTDNLTPFVETEYADASLLGVWLEEGSADRPGKVIGRYDADEIKYHLLAGLVGPEMLMSNGPAGVLGAPPRRICIAVCVEAMESFNVEDLAGYRTSQPASLHKHFIVLETDWKMAKDQDPSDVDVQFRIRNWNDVLEAEEGEKVSIDDTGRNF